MLKQITAFAFVACLSGTAAASDRPNILFLIADDLGVDALSMYGATGETAQTPTLNALAANGIRFTRFWTQPSCTPSRTEILTGRYGFRTGVRRQIGGVTDGEKPPPPKQPDGAPRQGASLPGKRILSIIQKAEPTWGPSADEFMLPQALKALDPAYATAAIGKWHMADRRNGWTEHPNIAGFDRYAGPFGGFPEGYYAWNKLVDGEWTTGTGYGVSDKVDDSLAWIAAQGKRPWFLWLAFNAPHKPFHKPPIELINTPALKALSPDVDPDDAPSSYSRAMIEALDTEIGRLLSAMDADTLSRTYIIFLGDNGSDRQAVGGGRDPRRAKGTLYQGGIHTPLIVAGPRVAKSQTVSGLVKTVDLYATAIELAGGDANELVPAGVQIDSVSLAPYLAEPKQPSVREYVYADFMPYSRKNGSGSYAISDGRYKYLVHRGRAELYDLSADYLEKQNLLLRPLAAEAKARLEFIQSELHQLRPDLRDTSASKK